MPRKVRPLSAFPPEYIALLKKAVNEEVSFTFSNNEAINKRQDLYACRQAMVKEKHPYADIVQAVVIKIKPTSPEIVELILTPASNDPFVTKIKEAVGDIGLTINADDFNKGNVDFNEKEEIIPIPEEEESIVDYGLILSNDEDEEGEEDA